MKVLHFAPDHEVATVINQMVKSQYPKIELHVCYDMAIAQNVLLNDGPFYFVIFDADSKLTTPEEFSLMMNELAGKRAIIVAGSANAIRSNVTSKILNDPSMSILEKPFTLESFNKAIKHAFDWGQKDEFEQSINEFTRDDLHPMKIRNFYLFDQLPYDVYLDYR